MAGYPLQIMDQSKVVQEAGNKLYQSVGTIQDVTYFGGKQSYKETGLLQFEQSQMTATEGNGGSPLQIKLKNKKDGKEEWITIGMYVGH